ALDEVPVLLGPVEVVDHGQERADDLRDDRLAVGGAVALDTGAEVLEVGLGAGGDLAVLRDEVALGRGEQGEVFLAQPVTGLRSPVRRGCLHARLAGLRVDLALVRDRGLVRLVFLAVLALVDHRYFRSSSSSTISASTTSSSEALSSPLGLAPAAASLLDW